jgi:hypothetical protein
LSGESSSDELSVLREYSVEPEADLARAFLEQAGVESRVTGNHSLGAGVEFGGRGSFQVVVRRRDLAAAEAALSEIENAEAEAEMVQGVCPRCGAEMVEASTFSAREVALRRLATRFVMSWPQAVDTEVNPSRRCRACGHRW